MSLFIFVPENPVSHFGDFWMFCAREFNLIIHGTFQVIFFCRQFDIQIRDHQKQTTEKFNTFNNFMKFYTFLNAFQLNRPFLAPKPYFFLAVIELQFCVTLFTPESRIYKLCKGQGNDRINSSSSFPPFSFYSSRSSGNNFCAPFLIFVLKCLKNEDQIFRFFQMFIFLPKAVLIPL